MPPDSRLVKNNARKALNLIQSALSGIGELGGVDSCGLTLAEQQILRRKLESAQEKLETLSVSFTNEQENCTSAIKNINEALATINQFKPKIKSNPGTGQYIWSSISPDLVEARRLLQTLRY